MKLYAAIAAATVLATTSLTACTVAGGAEGGENTVTVGYQSKTINTVTAGTLLKERGFFEKRLKELDEDYQVDWQDYDTGAPITAQMLAGKIDIGSMGDYPLLINGSRAGTDDSVGNGGTRMIAVTGYNPNGALNGVVVGADSKVEQLADLEGKRISASVGSAGHGTLVQALKKAGIDPNKDVKVENQDPSVGASSLQGGSVDAVAQFVAWPGLLTFRDGARLVYDGGQLGVPTLHGTVVRQEYVDSDKDVVKAFLQAQLDATTYLHEHPVEAAEIVAEATGLPVEVVYLYNGRGGVSTFDPTIKPEQVAALKQDVPFLESIGVLESDLDVDAFVDDSLIREAYGADYDTAAGSLANPAPIEGGTGEVWVDGEAEPRPVADAAALLREVKAVIAESGKLRASYIPDAVTGTRWFADKMTWLRDGAKLLPFATTASAEGYTATHPGTTSLTFDEALAAAK